MMRNKVIPVLWLILAAVIVGACIGTAVARADPWVPPPVEGITPGWVPIDGIPGTWGPHGYTPDQS